MVKSCNPVVFSFYNYLRTHPLIVRRHFASPDGSECNSNPDQINLIERKLFFTTANAHFKVGCPVLALEVLSKIPKVTKKTSLSQEASTANVSNVQNGVRASDLDWSQPVMKNENDELKLDWGDDENEEEEEEEDKKGLIIKEEKKDSAEEQEEEPEEEEKNPADWKVDVIAEQLKFRACLKILMTELRTLATGYEVDGGKLRFQLYNWLEKEIEAVHCICNYKASLQMYMCSISSAISSLFIVFLSYNDSSNIYKVSVCGTEREATSPLSPGVQCVGGVLATSVPLASGLQSLCEHG